MFPSCSTSESSWKTARADRSRRWSKSHYLVSLFAADHHVVKGNILLLRGAKPSSDSDQDHMNPPQNLRFLDSSAMLETVPTSITQLASVTAQDDLDGVIVTNARSYEA